METELTYIKINYTEYPNHIMNILICHFLICMSVIPPQKCRLVQVQVHVCKLRMFLKKIGIQKSLRVHDSQGLEQLITPGAVDRTF